MKCELVRKHADAYVDGELEAAAVVDFESHLSECGDCQVRVRFDREVKREINRQLAPPPAPRHLVLQVSRALDPDDDASRHALLLWSQRYALPTLAAAATLLGFTTEIRDGDGQWMHEAALQLPLLEDVVRRHSNELPSEISGEEPEKVVGWFRGKVGFPVRPVQFSESQVRLLGARISHVRERQAAALYYSVNGHRVTMVVFEPPSTLRNAARRTRIGNRDLYYQHVHGYTVPIMEHNGITYAFTGDLDRQALLKLAASAQLR